MATGLAFAAALAFAFGAVFQQRAAAEAPRNRALRAPVFRKLFRRPLWSGGIALLTAGYGFEVAALGTGSLLLVEPVLAASVLFALPISALWAHRRFGPREWLAAIATTAGLAAFLVVGQPIGGHATAAFGPWVPALVVTTGAIVLAGLATLRSSARSRALVIGAESGVAYGLADALTKAAIPLVVHRGFGALATWEPYGLAVFGIVALLLAQVAFHAAGLAASYASMNVAEPIAGGLLGLFLFGEQLRAGAVEAAVEGLAAVLMVIGVVALARSPLVSGRGLARQEPAQHERRAAERAAA